MRLEGWAFCIAALTAFPVGAAAVQAETDGPRTTAAGVFTEAQSKAGGDLYAGLCTGCHTMSSHTGVTFRKSWLGMPVSELFIYLSQSMPEDAPGSLSAKEYAQVVAYLLEMNGMPTGSTELPADEGALRAIRIDTVAAKSTGKRQLSPISSAVRFDHVLHQATSNTSSVPGSLTEDTKPAEVRDGTLSSLMRPALAPAS